jgi:hypothetical protein
MHLSKASDDNLTRVQRKAELLYGTNLWKVQEGRERRALKIQDSDVDTYSRKRKSSFHP